MQQRSNPFSLIWENIGFICAAVAAVFCIVHAFDPPRLNWGDSGSDYNVMRSGRNFFEHGFLQLRLTPYLLDPARIVSQGDRVFIYTHYPQLPDLMNGILRLVLRLTTITQFRFVALAFSFGSLFFIYRLVEAYWNRSTAQIALALWCWNPMWIQHADYLHHIPYGAFFGFGSVYFLRRYLLEQQRRWLVVSGAFLWLTYMASYDWWFFGPLLLAAATTWHHRELVSARVAKTLGFLAAFAVAAVAFKLATNIWALGGLDRFMKDLHFQFVERATDSITRTNYHNAVWPTLLGRVERFFTLLLFPIAAFWLLHPLLRRRFAALQTPVANPGVLFLAALPFLVLFTEIWVAQYYPAVLVIPFYAVGAAAIVSLVWQLPHRAAKLVAAILTIALLANSADENLGFPAAFFPETVGAQMKAQIDSVSPPNQRLIINHVFDAPYRYYMDRQVVGVTLIPPGVAELGLLSFADTARHPETATAAGAIFVQHKHVVDELYDKGYYYLFAKLRLWKPWGNPRAYRAFVDSIVADRDSTLMSRVGLVGHKLYDTDFYAIWRIDPMRPTVTPASSAPRSQRP